jgi:hypothetical protein
MGVSVTKEKAIPMQLKKLRAAFVNESGLALHRCLWAATKAPYEIRDGAIRDLTKAHKACREKKQCQEETRRKARAIQVPLPVQEGPQTIHPHAQECVE